MPEKFQSLETRGHKTSNAWKYLLLFTFMLAAFGTCVLASPGGQRGFFAHWYGASVVALQPDDVADMAGWWDASDASTISLVAGTNRVSEWRDKSGLDRHFTQTDANERPFYDVTQNGLNAMRTAGAEGMHYNTGDQTVWRFLHEGKASIFIAFEVIGPQGSGFGIILDTSALANGTYYIYDNRATLGLTNALRLNAGSSSIQNYSLLQNELVTVDSPQIWSSISDATNATAANRLFIYDENDARINNDNAFTGSFTGNTSRDLSFGQESASGLYDLDMKIFELIIYSNNVTEAERSGLIDYLSTKWGI